MSEFVEGMPFKELDKAIKEGGGMIDLGKSQVVIGEEEAKYFEYFRDVSNINKIDIYRFLKLFNVIDPCIQHAVKKLVLPGIRTGEKPLEEDVTEAIDTLNRMLEMMEEDK